MQLAVGLRCTPPPNGRLSVIQPLGRGGGEYFLSPPAAGWGQIRALRKKLSPFDFAKAALRVKTFKLSNESNKSIPEATYS
jgi:hypothetical protein